ncbi:MAG: hypothetical protein M3072_04795 [Candidatus Dormibacteraeota bacterium]|nr:hypothetical protein [Candidatus Dormibacteraeota bacterium]
MRFESELPWAVRLLEEMAGSDLIRGSGQEPTVQVRIGRSHVPFEVAGREPLTRGAWLLDGQVIMEDVCSSGFDLRVTAGSAAPIFDFRWRPRAQVRLATNLLRVRAKLLTRAVLGQYPALWAAGARGRVPLHAPACSVGGRVALVAGPAGVGKSTLIRREIAAGGAATSDNLGVGDGSSVWGLVEPLRVEVRGRRTTGGRGEVDFAGRVAVLEPDMLVVLRRGMSEAASVRACDAELAGRALVTGTYAAGELRRYWAFAATLSAGLGVGPDHPPIAEVGRGFAARLRCVEITLGRRPGARLGQLLLPAEVRPSTLEVLA